MLLMCGVFAGKSVVTWLIACVLFLMFFSGVFFRRKLSSFNKVSKLRRASGAFDGLSENDGHENAEHEIAGHTTSSKAANV